MIQVSGLAKSYGERVLFKDLAFSINRGDRIGLVGRNGAGKSTLFGMLLGRVEPDDGVITVPRHYRIGHLEQHISFTKSTVLEEGCRGLREEEKDEHWKVEKILSGLGFSKEDMGKSPSLFSGGYQIRLNLAKVLVSAPDLLLLDEPNNYLDIIAARWLGQFLRAWKREVMLITHDRSFMDSVTTHTMIIHRKKIKKIEGGTSKLYDQIAQEEEIHERTRLHGETERKKTELFIRRFRAKARLGGLVQSRIKTLAKREKKEKLEKIENLEFSFNAAPFPAAQMMAVYNVRFSHRGGRSPLIDSFSVTVGRRDRIGVIGRNGKGKTTLLRLLAGELSPQSGNIKIHPSVKTGYFGQSNIARLAEDKAVLEEIREDNPDAPPQAVRSVCGAMMFGGDEALKKVGVLSGGERARVLMGKLLINPANLLLLDEPTNHLDMESADALLEAIDGFEGSVMMVTHNEMFLHALATRLIVFDRGRVTLFDGTYGEFLERVGWQDEETDGGREKAKERTADERKELRKRRAEAIQERSQALRPLEARIKELERAIGESEQELHRTTGLLVEASAGGDAGAIAELSRKHHRLRPHIDELYDRLEKTLSEYEQECERYKQRLAALDDAAP